MDQKTEPRRSGSYTANLLGNNRCHLAGLQGYDVMALELIQNEDDAKAEAAVARHLPDTTLKAARDARDGARSQLASRIDVGAAI